jgi:hypothetical protein
VYEVTLYEEPESFMWKFDCMEIICLYFFEGQLKQVQRSFLQLYAIEWIEK